MCRTQDQFREENLSNNEAVVARHRLIISNARHISQSDFEVRGGNVTMSTAVANLPSNVVTNRNSYASNELVGIRRIMSFQANVSNVGGRADDEGPSSSEAFGAPPRFMQSTVSHVTQSDFEVGGGVATNFRTVRGQNFVRRPSGHPYQNVNNSTNSLVHGQSLVRGSGRNRGDATGRIRNVSIDQSSYCTN